MYGVGYLDVVDELKLFLEAIIHTLFYKHGIYPPDSFTTTKRFGINVRRHNQPEVIHYVQQIIDVFHLLLKDKILRDCAIVIEENGSPKNVITYNLQVEHFLYKTPIRHFDTETLHNEFAKALMKIEIRKCGLQRDLKVADTTQQLTEPCDFNVYFYTISKLKGAIIKGFGPKEENVKHAYAYSPPILELEKNRELSSAPRDYIQSIVLPTGETYDDTDTDVPLIQLYTCE
ncbi:uncharacterized protein BXIN_2925 [Babesia sp. Xinjiang]|uniref:uncharacterized protein n=1 Tax=Babesia sp. Xinjiang TaxID=462227 RepID=UPI000A22EDEF|nr:uncharacterized protein BXIN_2925 [Babesia sp. Xinjiang]ORM39539.1 hypothetical protein BXIN_2925 [Babesia sp. Xinjiang]